MLPVIKGKTLISFIETLGFYNNQTTGFSCPDEI